MERDLLIIGGGPGGYEAAIKGAQLGLKVTLIEEDKMGGTCLNRGCIPTKALYKNSEIINSLKNINNFGVAISDYNIDMVQIQNRKNIVVNKLVSGIDQLLKGYGIEVIKGRAVLKGNKTIEINADGSIIEITAQKIIIATGSTTSSIQIPGIGSKGVLTSDEALNLEHIPKSMVILGGGVIGVEFAGIFAALGTQVTIIEFMPRILYRLDEELSKKLTLQLKKQGIKIVTGTSVKEITETEDGLKIIASNTKGTSEYICDNLLISIGRVPNIKGLGLENEKIEFDNKGIKVNKFYQTSSDGIYAIGDVIGGQMLAHVASEEGKVCVENILGLNSNVNYNAVPSCVYSFPELATVGLTETEANEKNIKYLTGKFMFGANGKALTMGEGEGFIKVMAHEDSHEIIGVHILGPHASDLIHEGVLAIQNRLTVEDIKESIHSHPTLAEVFYEAVCDCIGEAIHTLPKKNKK